jgi:hypothetical protein
MATPHFEVPAGDVDGVNTVFTVAAPYRPGSTALFLNGQLKRADYDDGWTESNPETGEVTLAEAPLTDDVVQVFYLDYVVTNLQNVTRIVGILRPLP